MLGIVQTCILGVVLVGAVGIVVVALVATATGGSSLT